MEAKMARKRKMLDHMSVAEIDEQIKETVGFWRVRRWMIIRQAVVSDLSAEELGMLFGLSVDSVRHLISAYNQKGVEGVEVKGKGQRQRAYLSHREEADFLNPFIKKAEHGYISTIRDIHQELEKQLGHSIHKTTVYRLLKRQGWRKLSPRPSHVKSDKEKQLSFKKTSKTTLI